MQDDPRQPVGQGDLTVEEESLSDFARRLDDLSLKLGASVGSHETLAGLGITAAQAGGSLAEMTSLTSRYEHVLERVRALARVQREAIEALGIATLISERGYENVEAEQIERLRSLMSGWEQVYTAGSDRRPATTTAGDQPAGGGGGGAPMAL
ncbi:hypothetical protein [Streptomyces sp. 7-21]|jgi:hypothetical protein|uniref:hypothetical protein n=1 Tax=Streptomyces sp. 7-21 TaxID=2802283 RepID=UPI00191FC417|nr:hypothetical protein [Streptomyces sp. 7-21]MBL1068304.1 hypothetical protein [Streptomyces sp. 7-21]